MKKDTPPQARFHTRISASTKDAFERFLLRKYGMINGVFSREVSLAISAYVSGRERQDGARPVANIRPHASTSAAWRSILAGLETQEAYPLVSITILDRVIRGLCGFRDRRTILKYRNTILKHARVVTPPGEVFPKYDISGFAAHVRGVAV